MSRKERRHPEPISHNLDVKDEVYDFSTANGVNSAMEELGKINFLVGDKTYETIIGIAFSGQNVLPLTLAEAGKAIGRKYDIIDNFLSLLKTGKKTEGETRIREIAQAGGGIQEELDILKKMKRSESRLRGDINKNYSNVRSVGGFSLKSFTSSCRVVTQATSKEENIKSHIAKILLTGYEKLSKPPQ